MGLLIVIILIVAIATGTLWQVLEIAAGVALGIFLAVVLLAVAAYYRFRRAFREQQRRWFGDRHPYDR